VQVISSIVDQVQCELMNANRLYLLYVEKFPVKIMHIILWFYHFNWKSL